MRKVASGFSAMIAVQRKSGKPLHRQIYEAYRALIVGRSLHPGQQIPSTRALADELKISRIPVLTAYAQLLAEGYFEARVGAGTFVCCMQFITGPSCSDRAPDNIVLHGSFRASSHCTISVAAGASAR
jgi:DNA-binding transcriptional MocR family regulator